MEEQKWQCENPKCRAVYAEYVNGCPKCATGEAGGSYSVVLTKKEKGWIKITKDTFPPKGERIDIWIDNKNGEGVRWTDCYYDEITDEWRSIEPGKLLKFVSARYVTHWMPVPPVPEKPWQP